LDIVSAQAGIGGFGLSWEISEDSWKNMLDVNLTGVWHACKAAIPHILNGGRGGCIVMTSSVYGLKGTGNSSHYIASKHGVVGLMRSLAVELAPHWIRVNSLHPTQVNTDMIQNDACRRLFLPDDPAPSQEAFAAVSQSMNLLPVPWVEPLDVSNALLFLVSDEARYITGAMLPVDAGSLLI
jgi:NAD(P)-dependent dehydrogenase (short-subunit alcohol dehydrogenase family)